MSKIMSKYWDSLILNTQAMAKFLCIIFFFKMAHKKLFVFQICHESGLSSLYPQCWTYMVWENVVTNYLSQGTTAFEKKSAAGGKGRKSCYMAEKKLSAYVGHISILKTFRQSCFLKRKISKRTLGQTPCSNVSPVTWQCHLSFSQHFSLFSVVIFFLSYFSGIFQN